MKLSTTDKAPNIQRAIIVTNGHGSINPVYDANGKPVLDANGKETFEHSIGIENTIQRARS